MYEQIDKPKESKSRAVANSGAQKKNSGKQGVGFVDNRPEALAQRKLREVTDGNSLRQQKTTSIQMMAAYDSENIDLLEDPRHFSTSEIKDAIDECIKNQTAVPSWLQEQIAGYLKDELWERLKDMEKHGGGDKGHKDYYELVQDYVEKIEGLSEETDSKKQVPMEGGPAAQLRENFNRA